MLNMPLLFYHSIKTGHIRLKANKTHPASSIAEAARFVLLSFQNTSYILFSSELPKFHPGTIQKSESRRYINGISLYAMTDYSSRLL